VLLCGWLGSEASHLKKYSNIYEDFGAKVATMSPTFTQVAVPSSGDRAALRYLQAIRDDLRAHQGPTFVHCMSNAGWLAFGSMLRLSALVDGQGVHSPKHYYRPLDKDLQALTEFRSSLCRVSGIIIDSAPSLATPHIWARGTLAAILQKPVDHVDRFTHPNAMAVAHSAAEHYLALPSIARRLREIRAAWFHNAPLAPQLYLYSCADALIPAPQVESFMAQQAARGVSVDAHCWPDSPHCEHLRYHPEHYRRLVHAFLRRCLGYSDDIANWV